MNFIIFSTADWDNPFWTNKQHTAAKLSQRGHKVLYIESLGLRAPSAKSQDLSRIAKRIKRFLNGARQVKENIWVFSPLVIPLHRFKLIKKLNDLLMRIYLKLLKRKLKFSQEIYWTYTPTVYEILPKDRNLLKVYHCVDDLSASPGIDKDLIENSEKEIGKQVDLIFCTSHKLLKKLKPIANGKCFYFPNVVDKEHFENALKDQEKPQELIQIHGPMIGFVGAISDYKVDYKLINETAKLHPDWNFILIGKVGEGQPGTQIKFDSPNIFLLGPKDYQELPRYIHFFDVCLIPAPLNNYTHSMFPMKFFEYMAAQKPIVSSKIDSLKDFSDAVYSYDRDMSQAISEALKHRVQDLNLYQKLVNNNTWDNRLDKMLEKIHARIN